MLMQKSKKARSMPEAKEDGVIFSIVAIIFNYLILLEKLNENVADSLYIESAFLSTL
jgi:hypothetical protein